MIKQITLSAVLALGLTTSLQARSFGEIYTQCGLGALIAKDVPVVAAVTNVTWDLGTTAITSDLTNGCSVKDAKVAAFINKSYKNLENDLAKGNGKYLDSLVAMTKPQNVSKEDFVNKLREKSAKIIISDASEYDKSKALYDIVM